MNVTITAGVHGYKNCPLSVAIDSDDLVIGGATIVDAEGVSIPCQVFDEGGERRLAWIEPEIKAGETKTYTVEPAPCCGNDVVEIEDIGDRLEVRIGGELFTRYHFGTEWPRPFLYPFIGPGEVNVTRNFPMRTDAPNETTDHKHHRSVWVAYGEVNRTDNWSEDEGHAFQRHLRFEEITSGPVFGRIRAVNSWTSKDGTKQMEDVREFTFYALRSERLMDVSVKFVATEGEVLLGDTKEGGIISVRMATSMDGNKGGTITNSRGGLTEKQTWGRPAEWVDYYGPVDGKTLGVTIMDSPDSFRYPSRWHVRDYGLFTANPFALKHYEPEKGLNGDYTMVKGEELNFGYRLYVHEGTTEQAGVAEKYFGFTEPPNVQIG